MKLVLPIHRVYLIIGLVCVLLLGFLGIRLWSGDSDVDPGVPVLSEMPSPGDPVHPHAHKLRNSDGSWRYTNRLAESASPYLLLHAHNPVDWFPWGADALGKARAEDKPIFLSVGYSTCYWCHVMERLVFSDPEIAQMMNDWFVNIKVDKEERPDLDRIYMTATQLMTGRGGWPNSVFLTPELKPFFAGTYFAPEDANGRPGFPRVLRALRGAWADRRSDIEDQAEQMVVAIKRYHTQEMGRSNKDSISNRVVQLAVDHLRDRFDKNHGGFSDAPKFPPDPALELLMSRFQETGDKELIRMVTSTLDQIALGGMRDHLGGGFHRYSTDRYWHVPHFEKMLYNQAQLAKNYLIAYEITGKESYKQVIEELFSFVSGTMTSPEGGFYSALDSETHGVEGEYYLWEDGEIREELGTDVRLFSEAYRLIPMPNEEGNVVILQRPLSFTADSMGIGVGVLHDRLAPLRRRLLTLRSRRAPPLLDTKVITAWNGLMIDAYSVGYRILGDTSYLEAAVGAADFILQNMVDQADGLMRISREGKVTKAAYQEDYAFLIQGLVSLFEVSGRRAYLTAAKDLATQMEELFWDSKSGGFYFTSSGEDLITRTKNPHDSAMPSGNSAAVNALLRLYENSNDESALHLAENTLQTFLPAARGAPGAYLFLILGAHKYLALSDKREVPAYGGRKMKSSSDVVHATASVVGKSGGQALEIRVDVSIAEGWHLNANPASPDFLIPTTLTVRSDSKVELHAIRYPPSRPFTSEFSSEPISVYSKSVAILAKLRMPVAVDSLYLRLQFQACDDSRCLNAEFRDIPLKLR